MNNFDNVMEYFEKICSVPHGSGDMERISEFLVNFGKEKGLRVYQDEALNVVIYKNGTKGYENSKPLILQGHMDMVCQKTEESAIDFSKDRIKLVKDGDYIKAEGTTLGADNGIAVAMIMSILESVDIPHPPIEAVFTTDEEIGMIGASNFDMTQLEGKRMINLDAEEEDILTVSCAGGSDLKLILPLKRESILKDKITIKISGLKGGHSGVEIDKGRVNANILMGRILNFLRSKENINLVNIKGGTKSNAIPVISEAELVTESGEKIIKELEGYIKIVKEELKEREENLNISYDIIKNLEVMGISKPDTDKIIYMLMTTPNGVIDMSMEIEGLVETSLNLGILNVGDNVLTMQYAMRSNKKTALDFLEEKMIKFGSYNGFGFELSGRYEPWEYREKSELQRIYKECYEAQFKKDAKISAIHAGLECAVFSAKINELDCIAMGPDMTGVHTVYEKLSIPSARSIFELLCTIIGKCK